jgi:hypothetical protein
MPRRAPLRRHAQELHARFTKAAWRVTAEFGPYRHPAEAWYTRTQCKSCEPEDDRQARRWMVWGLLGVLAVLMALPLLMDNPVIAATLALWIWALLPLKRPVSEGDENGEVAGLARLPEGHAWTYLAAVSAWLMWAIAFIAVGLWPLTLIVATSYSGWRVWRIYGAVKGEEAAEATRHIE